LGREELKLNRRRDEFLPEKMRCRAHGIEGWHDCRAPTSLDPLALFMWRGKERGVLSFAGA
jgi:hypothetical protein